jgi:hypothetical protein
MCILESAHTLVILVKKTLNSKSGLNKHLHIHSGECPYRCNIYKKAFNISSDLNKHLHVHSGERPYPCDVCTKSFHCRSNVNVHLSVHTGEHLYPCNIIRNALCIRMSLRNICVYIIMNIHLVEFVINALVNISISNVFLGMLLELIGNLHHNHTTTHHITLMVWLCCGLRSQDSIKGNNFQVM